MSFDQFAKDYKTILDQNIKISGEGSEYFAAYKANYIARLLGPGFTGRILDYGCGVGLLSGCLAKTLPRASLSGYDVSAESLKQVPPALKDRGLFTDVAGDLNPPFDAIVLANVLHHVEAPARARLVVGLAKLLAPAGNLIIFEHNPFNPLTRKVVRECAFDEGVTLLPSRESLSYLQQSGLAFRQLDYTVFFPKFLKFCRPLESWLGWCPLGAQYAAIGTQPQQSEA